MTAESLFLTGAPRIYRNVIGIFFNILEKVAPYNSFSDTPGNILNVDESDIQIINKPDSIIRGKISENINVLTSGGKSGNITVTTCCNAAGTFLPTLLISKGVNEKEDFGDVLFPKSVMSTNCKSLYIGTDSFIKWSTEYSIKNEASAKVILILDGHRTQSTSSLLLQIVVKNNVNIVHLLSHFTCTLHASDKSFFWPFKSYFKYEAVVLKITRYCVALLFWFVWSNAASVRVGVSAFKSTARVPEYMFSISDTSETITSVETAPSNMAIVCLTSILVTTSQNL